MGYQKFSLSLVSLALASIFASTAYAEKNVALTRIKELEVKIELMQQRAEQDKQLELVTKELVGFENQLSQSKIAKTEEKGSSKGGPVYAAFKDGVMLEDGTGN